LGVKEEPKINGKARSFLIEKTKGKRVFLKFDKIKYDVENNLLCYLYLENKTFINAHLIKNGLANVDESYDYKYKNKFLTLLQQKNG
jgi:site-specific DNA-methyltransferase (adenine-specific)